MKLKNYLGMVLLICFMASLPITANEPQIGGYVQYLGQNDESAVDQLGIRRARLSVKGDLNEDVSYSFLTDAVTSATSGMLWKACIDIKTLPYFTIRMGQFKTPFSKTYLASSTKHDTVSLANGINSLTSKYDSGIQVMGQQSNIKYAVGVFNGSGRNAADVNDNKDIIGRVDFVKLIDGLEFGGAGYYGKNKTTNAYKKGIAANVLYKMSGLTLKSELIQMNDGDTTSQGGFLQAGYYFLPECEAVVMYDYYDVNNNVDSNEISAVTLGVNYVLNKSTKIQTNYVINMEKSNSLDNNQLLIQTQVVF
jgi:hypothetical protein